MVVVRRVRMVVNDEEATCVGTGRRVSGLERTLASKGGSMTVTRRSHGAISNFNACREELVRIVSLRIGRRGGCEYERRESLQRHDPQHNEPRGPGHPFALSCL